MEPNSKPSSSVSKGEAKEMGQPLGLKKTYLRDRLHKIQEVLKGGMVRLRKSTMHKSQEVPETYQK